MKIDFIESYELLERVESNWQEVYERDPEAKFFLSWGWISGLLSRRRRGWCVLAAKPEDRADDYVAFFPVRLKTSLSNSSGVFRNEILMAGSYSWADYTGFICDPTHEEQAIPGFATAIQRLRWARLDLRHIDASDRRIELFTARFGDEAFVINSRKSRNKQDGTDLTICPYVRLPDSFEHYLQDHLSANTRQKVRRLLRRIEGSEEFRITHSVPDTFERDADILMGFWRTTWAKRKSDDVDRLAGRYRQILLEGLSAGLLDLPVLWRGNEPLGALGNFIDAQKKRLLYFIAGRDESCRNPPPGFVLHAYCIRWAIAHGLKTYDFLRGNESFKYSFGASDHRIRNIVVKTRSGENLHGGLEPRCVGDALGLATEADEAGLHSKAKAGYNQIILVAPKHPTALRRFARLLYQTGEYVDAQELCLRLVRSHPGNAAAWRQLGKTRLKLRKLADAEWAFRRANAIDPTITAHHYLSRAIEAQGRTAEATELHRSMLRLTPRGPREKSHQKKAREALQ